MRNVGNIRKIIGFSRYSTVMKKLLHKIIAPTYLKVTILIILVYLVLMAVNPKFINNLEMKFYDLMFNMRGTNLLVLRW